jgi:hypothetical protein
MKTISLILILFFIVLLVGCNSYHKKTEIDRGLTRNDLHYYIIIYDDFEMVKLYSIPLETATKERVDSINRSVDSLIVVMNNLD